MSSKPTLLEMRNIVKRFPGVVANDHVNFSVQEGEIHALLGENGAGKSTLMKILYGMYEPDEGTIVFRGDPVDFDGPKDAIAAGIGMVHQHFMLIPRLTVTENVILGQTESPVTSSTGESHILSPLRKLAQLLTIDTGGPKQRIEELATQYGMDISPDAKVWQLGVGEQQQVEILKTLYQDADLLILDEPTAVLTPEKIDQLFEILRHLVEQGLTVIIITHKLEEIKRISDRTTVLRDGKVVDTVDTATVSKSDLAEMMVGREVLFEVDREDVSVEDVVLHVSNLSAVDDRGVKAVDDVSFEVSAGEILGIAGVSGNGQTELAECLVGLREPTAGKISVKTEQLAGKPPEAFVDAGVSFIPEDRIQYGAATDLSVEDNAVMKEISDFADRGLLDHNEKSNYAERLVEEFDVRVPDVDVSAGKLSGGNLQKLIVARELSRNPEVLIANQPTRGVDVGAIEYIQNTLLEQRQKGTGTVLISEKLEEVLQLSDRILVIYEGSIVHETTTENADRDRIGRMMAGDSHPPDQDSSSPPNSGTVEADR